MTGVRSSFLRARLWSGVLVIGGVVALAGCASAADRASENPSQGALRVAQATPSLPDKIERVKALIRERAMAGADITGYLSRMDEAGAKFEAGKPQDGEKLVDQVLADLEGAAAPPAPAVRGAERASGAFANPQVVEVRGYDNSHGAMEPFLSRDGQYLLFNSAPGGGPPDLHYARRIDAAIFEYLGRISGANSGEFDGGPTMDGDGTLYFSSTRQYESKLATLYRARFEGGEVGDVALVPGDISKQQRGWLNMDSEISADGNTLYFTDNQWDATHNIPATSDIVIARRSGNSFQRLENSDYLTQNINTDDLEYAVSISPDELTLFYTRGRFNLSGGQVRGMSTGIFIATRSAPDAPFGAPELISAISGFVEGPTISPDGRILYYHKKEGGEYRIYKVERQG